MWHRLASENQSAIGDDMKVGFTLTNIDGAYVERRGGVELFVHMSGASARVECRRTAIQRAWVRFVAAEGEGRPDPEVGGFGLIVIQRALLASEDLGGLLHALSRPDPWRELRTAGIAEIDASFQRASRDPEGVMSDVFRLPTAAQITHEAVTSAEREALERLRQRTVIRWQQMLSTAAALWLTHRHVAKATLHAFPFVAGEHVSAPPGAGALSDGVQLPKRRYALLLASTLKANKVHTPVTTVALDHNSVDRCRREGRLAARLYGELCEAQVASIAGRFGATLPTKLLRADDPDRAILDGLLGGGSG